MLARPPTRRWSYTTFFISEQLAVAARELATGSCWNDALGAFFDLGLGAHAVADSFSPFHGGFQVWSGIIPPANTVGLLGAWTSDWNHHVAEGDDRPEDLEVQAAANGVREYWRTFQQVATLGMLGRRRDHSFYFGLSVAMLGLAGTCRVEFGVCE